MSASRSRNGPSRPPVAEGRALRLEPARSRAGRGRRALARADVRAASIQPSPPARAAARCPARRRARRAPCASRRCRARARVRAEATPRGARHVGRAHSSPHAPTWPCFLSRRAYVPRYPSRRGGPRRPRPPRPAPAAGPRAAARGLCGRRARARLERRAAVAPGSSSSERRARRLAAKPARGSSRCAPGPAARAPPSAPPSPRRRRRRPRWRPASAAAPRRPRAAGTLSDRADALWRASGARPRRARPARGGGVARRGGGGGGRVGGSSAARTARSQS